MRRATAYLLALAALGLPACGENAEDAGEPTAGDENACEEVAPAEPKQVDVPEPPTRPSADRLVAVVQTNCGAFEIALTSRESPKTVASFEHLADNGVYDGTPFHRVVPGFVIQGGDPKATGLGGPGYNVLEPPPLDSEYTRGVVAMAKSPAEPPGASGSQFFVVTGADAGLPPHYAVLGEVAGGMDVVQTIGSFGDPTGQSEEPLEPVVIDSVTIEGS